MNFESQAFANPGPFLTGGSIRFFNPVRPILIHDKTLVEVSKSVLRSWSDSAEKVLNKLLKTLSLDTPPRIHFIGVLNSWQIAGNSKTINEVGDTKSEKFAPTLPADLFSVIGHFT